MVDIIAMLFCFSECSLHCSLCYNETECNECTQGYFLTENGECQSKSNWPIWVVIIAIYSRMVEKNTFCIYMEFNLWFIDFNHDNKKSAAMNVMSADNATSRRMT